MAKQKTVSKADLVDFVAESTSMKKKDVKEVMDTCSARSASTSTRATRSS